MKYDLTEHAKRAMAEREIEIGWLERVLDAPRLREPDPEDDTLERWFLAIPEREDRVLRVVVNVVAQPIRVVSAFFDRSKMGKL